MGYLPRAWILKDMNYKINLCEVYMIMPFSTKNVLNAFRDKIGLCAIIARVFNIFNTVFNRLKTGKSYKS